MTLNRNFVITMACVGLIAGGIFIMFDEEPYESPVLPKPEIQEVVIHNFEKEAKRKMEVSEKRHNMCERFCIAHDQHIISVASQKLCFGSFEQRCFCDDGYWQPMP